MGSFEEGLEVLLVGSGHALVAVGEAIFVLVVDRFGIPDALVGAVLVQSVEVGLHGGYQVFPLQLGLQLLIHVQLQLVRLLVLLHK